MFSFRKYLSRAAGALALLLTPGFAHGHDHGAPMAEAAPVNAPVINAPALWKLTDEDTTIYLFGTVHVLPDGVQWLDERITSALASADQFVTEVDMREMEGSAQLMASAGIIQTGQTLRSMMTEEDRAEYEVAVASLGMPVEAFDPFEPWFASLNLSLLPLIEAGYDPASGVEMVLGGMVEGKSRAALESVAEQVAMFDGMPLETQLAMLDATVAAMPEVKTTVDSMVSEWLAGDADGLAELMNASVDDPALYQRLLVDRNANWVDWIEQRLGEPGTVFMAVGAGHLAGSNNVQTLMGAYGLKAERINY